MFRLFRGIGRTRRISIKSYRALQTAAAEPAVTNVRGGDDQFIRNSIFHSLPKMRPSEIPDAIQSLLSANKPLTITEIECIVFAMPRMYKQHIIPTLLNLLSPYLQGNIKSLSPVTCNIILKLYAKQKDIKSVSYLLSSIDFNNISLSLPTYNQLITMYTIVEQRMLPQPKWKLVQSILELMSQKSVTPDVATYTAIIVSLVKDKDWISAIDMHQRMILDKITPDSVSISCLMTSLMELKRYKDVIVNFEKAMEQKILLPNHDWARAFTAYRKLERIDSAVSWMNRRAEFGVIDDAIIYYQLSLIYFQQGNVESIVQLIATMRQHRAPMEPVYRVLIRAYSFRQNLDSAMDAFDQMQRVDHIRPSYLVFAELIRACCECESLHTMQLLLDQMKNVGITPDINVYESQLRLLWKLGRHDAAIEVADNMRKIGMPYSAITIDFALRSSFQLKNLDSIIRLWTYMLLRKEPILNQKLFNRFARSFAEMNEHQTYWTFVKESDHKSPITSYLAIDAYRKLPSPLQLATVVEEMQTELLKPQFSELQQKKQQPL